MFGPETHISPRTVALNIQDLVLFLPPEEFFNADNIARHTMTCITHVRQFERTVGASSTRCCIFNLIYLYGGRSSVQVDKICERLFSSNRLAICKISQLSKQVEMHLGAQFDYHHASFPFLHTLACSPLSYTSSGSPTFKLNMERLRLIFKIRPIAIDTISIDLDTFSEELGYISKAKTRQKAVSFPSSYALLRTN